MTPSPNASPALSEAVELLPCPFCGWPAELEHGSDHHGSWFNLGCSRHWGHDPDFKCLAGRIWYTETEEDEGEAIRQWNSRLSALPVVSGLGRDIASVADSTDAPAFGAAEDAQRKSVEEATVGTAIGSRVSMLRGEEEREKIGKILRWAVTRAIGRPPMHPDEIVKFSSYKILLLTGASPSDRTADVTPCQSEWQPIETAPRDGTRFLASTPAGCVDFYHWQDFGGEYPNSPKGWRDGFIAVYTEDSPNGPTHWMSLPAAPQPHGTTEHIGSPGRSPTSSSNPPSETGGA